MSLDGGHDLDALHEVCELHSVVVPTAGSGPRTGSMRLPPEAAACAAARRFVRSTLRRWGLTAGVVEDAVLVSSELAANAIVHAKSPFLLEIGVEDNSLRVSVSDAASVARSAWAIEPTHGLSVVDVLSESWGVTGALDGKTVWAVLPTKPEAPAQRGRAARAS
jgi:hypothetical protein